MFRLNDLGFIAHPNTGSRTIREALESLGAIEVGGYHEIHEPTISEVNFCFCTIRNPFDLMASWYFRTQSGPGVMEFNDWLPWTLDGDRHYEGPGGKLFYGREHCNLCCRFERLQEDFDNMLDFLCIPLVELAHIGKTKRPKGYRELYSAQSLLLIEREYEEQLEMGRYTF